jgi:hypothetical protein
MIGSLPSLWPWKIKPLTNELFISNLYIPKGYFTNSEFKFGMFFILIGLLSVLVLEYSSKKNAKKK